MPQPVLLYGPTGTPIASSVIVDGSTATGNHLAARVSIRPFEFGVLGSYSISGTTGTTGAGLGAIIIAAFRWTDATRFCLVRRVRVTQGWVATTFTAGACVAEMVIARAYTVNDITGGTAQTLTGNSGKRRTSMGNTLMGTFTMATTGALSGGTKALDANPCATLVSATTAVAGAKMLESLGNLWDPLQDGRYPIALASNEGFVIRSTAPATGTYATTVDVDWDEVASF